MPRSPLPACLASIAVGLLVAPSAWAGGAEGVVVRRAEDLDALAAWTARPAAERRFLLLDLRISPTIFAPYQEEILAAHLAAAGARRRD